MYNFMFDNLKERTTDSLIMELYKLTEMGCNIPQYRDYNYYNTIKKELALRARVQRS